MTDLGVAVAVVQLGIRDQGVAVSGAGGTGRAGSALVVPVDDDRAILTVDVDLGAVDVLGAGQLRHPDDLGVFVNCVCLTVDGIFCIVIQNNDIVVAGISA